MRGRAAVSVAALVACGTSAGVDVARSAKACRLLADRLELRMRLHEGELATFRSWSEEAGVEQPRHHLSPTLHDAVATYQSMLSAGGPCATVFEVDECSATIPSSFLADPEGGLARMKWLLEGMRGRGPCARARDTHPQRVCEWISMHLAHQERLLDLVQQGWQTPFDEHGRSTKHAALAASTMAEWRARIDYGLAAAPACATRVAASCEHLREGLPEATPAEVLARMKALRAAYRDGTSCPPRSASTAPSAPTTR